MATFQRKTTAGDICTRVVTITFADQPIAEAARLMRDQHVGCLVVVEEVAPGDRQVVGMLTDRDIATGVVAAEKELYGLRVADVMSRAVVSVREEDSMLDVLAAMRRKGVRRAPVVGPRDRLIGIVAMDDVLELVAQELQALAAAVGAAQRHEGVAPR